MHLKIYSRQVVCGNAFFTQLQASIDAWMKNNTAGERLVRVERNLEALTQLIGNFVPVVLDRNHLSKAPGRFDGATAGGKLRLGQRSEEHTSELQSLMRISYAVFCLKNKNIT